MKKIIKKILYKILKFCLKKLDKNKNGKIELVYDYNSNFVELK